jgi:uncharacterized protein YqjF (DUF2071 family)
MRKHDGIIEVTSRRRRGFGLRAELELTCSPVTELGESVPGSLEYFLVERYSMYVVTQDGIRRGPIHHDPWRLEGVDVGLIETNLLESIGVVPSGPALVHYAARQKTWFWPLREP